MTEKLKILGSLFILFLIFLFEIAFVKAACSLGANPLSMDARAIPGQTIVAVWNLYNLYGDRTTHIKINKIKGPDWQVSFEPELHEASYDVAGAIQTIEENLALERTDVVKTKPEVILEGTDYVKHPKEEGYILVKPVKIYIKVPENAELWKNYAFSFEAVGNCFMEPGAAMPSIATQLELNVKTISGKYYEEPVKAPEAEEKKPEVEKGPVRITGAVIGTNLAVGVLAISSFILVIVILFLLVRVKRTRLKTKKVKKE